MDPPLEARPRYSSPLPAESCVSVRGSLPLFCLPSFESNEEDSPYELKRHNALKRAGNRREC